MDGVRLIFKSLIVTLTLLVGSQSLAADGAVLWRSVRVGMSEADVRRLIPEARTSESFSASASGWVDLLTARFKTDAADQQASFQFKGDQLMGVVVMEGQPFGLAPISEKVAKATLADTRKQFGNPVRCRDTDDGFHACFWLKEGKFIGYLERPPPTSATMLFFHVERPGDAELLK